MSATDCRCCHAGQPCECCAWHSTKDLLVVDGDTGTMRPLHDCAEAVADARRERDQLQRTWGELAERFENQRVALAEARAEIATMRAVHGKDVPR